MRFLIRIRVMSTPVPKTSPLTRPLSDDSGSGRPEPSRSGAARQESQERKERKQNAERRNLAAALARRGARPAGRARLPAFHCGSCQGDCPSPRRSSSHASCDSAGACEPMDRQPGRVSHASPRALPAPACPSPASTSRAGHNAGRLMPEPPERGSDKPPPAGTAPRSAGRSHPAGVLHEERGGALILVTGLVSRLSRYESLTLLIARYFLLRLFAWGRRRCEAIGEYQRIIVTRHCRAARSAAALTSAMREKGGLAGTSPVMRETDARLARYRPHARPKIQTADRRRSRGINHARVRVLRAYHGACAVQRLCLDALWRAAPSGRPRSGGTIWKAPARDGAAG